MNKRILLAILAAATFAATATAQDQKPAATEPPQTKIVQDVFDCLSGGLAAGWKTAWVNVLEIGRSKDGKSRNYEANMRFTTKDNDFEGEPLRPCDSARVIKSVGDLNEFLKPEARAWTAAQLVITSDGKFEIIYDYTDPNYEEKPAATKPAAATKPGELPAVKPAARKPGSGFKLKSQ